MKRAFTVVAIVAFGAIFGRLVADYSERQTLSPLAEHYLTQVPLDLGAPNVVTGILITFRGFDTLGEVAVLFMVAAGIGILLGKEPDEMPVKDRNRSGMHSELIQNGVEVVLPLILLFGVYVIMHGHLSAGGGFQGGAV